MITWMQKRKKYLVVTIWVSTIAFVGAGFVGWGAYDFNTNRATSVAKVGHRNISVQDLNEKYSQLYNYYNSVFNGQLTEEKATEMGLSGAALSAAINDSLLLNFADDIGLSVSDEDVIAHIMADENFKKDGVFSENLYKDVLRRARINPKDYEKNLVKTILLSKLSAALNVNINDTDLQVIGSAFGIEDTLAIKIIQPKTDQIKASDDELKALWESSKNEYMTQTVYSFDTITLSAHSVEASDENLLEYYKNNQDNYKDAEDKILSFDSVKDKVKADYDLEQTRTEALEKYVALKGGKVATDGMMSFSEDSLPFEIENLKGLKQGDVLKPILHDGKYLILKVSQIKLPQVMNFEQARAEVLDKFKIQKTKQILEDDVKAGFKDFDASKAQVVKISRLKSDDVAELDMFESRTFIDQVFASTNKKGFVMLDNKAVIYEVLEQKLLTEIKDENKELVGQNIASVKNGEILKDLTKVLQKRYKVEEYIKR